MELKNSSWSDEEKKENDIGLVDWEERMRKARKEFVCNEENYEKGMKLLKEHYETNVKKTDRIWVRY